MEFYNDPVPFCIIPNYYDDEQLGIIWSELKNIQPHLRGPKTTGSAIDILGNPRKSNSGLFLPKESPIVTLNRKLFTSEIVDKLIQGSWFFSYLKHCNDDSTLVSFYTYEDHYKPHTDMSVITAIYYLWKEPKMFQGGDLFFGNYKVPIQNNSLLVFPSCTMHGVTPVHGSGRYAITQFVTIKEIEQDPIKRFPNFLSVVEFASAKEIIDKGSWTFGKSNEDDPSDFLNMPLTHEKFFTEHMFSKIRMITGINNLSLIRVYANGHQQGQDGRFHRDDPGDDTFTFILYMNEISPDDLDDFYGVTEFKKMAGEIRAFQPETNMGLLFPSNFVHRGRSPSRLVSKLRVTIAWKLRVLAQ